MDNNAETPIVQPPQTPSQTPAQGPSPMFDVTLMGDVDVSRFLNQELTPQSREVVRHQIGGGATSQAARIAVVPVVGVLTKYGSLSGPSTLQIANEVSQLANSGMFDGLMLLIDSPGGEAAFVYDAVDAIRAAAKKIPIHARISDLGASGGYALACACDSISVNEQGSTGAIGTYIAVQDWSAFMEKNGVKTYVIAADGGSFKGMGSFGTEITKEHQDYLKERANSLNQLFLKTVSVGRKMPMEQASKLADGRVHIGADALKLGLVDAVCSLESALESLANAAKPKAVMKNVSQQQQQKETVKMEPATFEELEQALPKAFGEKASAEDAQWGMKLMKSKPTLDSARQAWNQRLEDKLEAQQAAMQEQIKSAEKQAAEAAAKTKLPGVTIPKQAVDTPNANSGDLVQEYHDAIRSAMQGDRVNADGTKSRVSRLDATIYVNRRRPDLHQAYLISTNQSDDSEENKLVSRLIGGRFKGQHARA